MEKKAPHHVLNFGWPLDTIVGDMPYMSTSFKYSEQGLFGRSVGYALPLMSASRSSSESTSPGASSTYLGL